MTNVIMEISRKQWKMAGKKSSVKTIKIQNNCFYLFMSLEICYFCYNIVFGAIFWAELHAKLLTKVSKATQYVISTCLYLFMSTMLPECCRKETFLQGPNTLFNVTWGTLVIFFRIHIYWWHKKNNSSRAKWNWKYPPRITIFSWLSIVFTFFHLLCNEE